MARLADVTARLQQAQHLGIAWVKPLATKSIERGHVFTRDKLRAARGVKPLSTAQRFFEALHARRRGHVPLASLVPGYDDARATVHERVRAVACVVTALGARLRPVAAPAA
jgi:hypothetical protein